MTRFGISKIGTRKPGIPFEIPKRLGLRKLHGAPVALKPVISLNFRHKKRRPWTSLDDEVVGRGNLNQFNKVLILKGILSLIFVLEYHLEYIVPIMS
ncbi:hypothetical protein [Pseudomonas spelaei]